MRETKRVGLRQRAVPDSDADLRALFAEREQGVAGQLDRMEAAAVGVLLKAGLPGAVGSYAVTRDGTWRDLPPGEVSDAGEVSVAHPALAPSFDLTVEQTAAELLDALRWLRPWLDKSPEHRRAALHGLRVGQLARSLMLRELWEAHAERGGRHGYGSQKGGLTQAAAGQGMRMLRIAAFGDAMLADPDAGPAKWASSVVVKRPDLWGGSTEREIDNAKRFYSRYVKTK